MTPHGQDSFPRAACIPGKHRKAIHNHYATPLLAQIRIGLFHLFLWLNGNPVRLSQFLYSPNETAVKLFILSSFYLFATFGDIEISVR